MDKKWFYSKSLKILGALLLLYPAIVGLTGWVKDPKLHGGLVKKEDVAFSFRGWWNGTWQEHKEEFVRENFGCRNYLVRLHNEIDYRFFRKGHNQNLVIGKEDYLYEKEYILTYFGLDFLGVEKIQIQINKMKEAERILSARGKTLIVVLASGKGSFYPEYFPDDYKNFKKGTTNYETAIQLANETGINFIDFSTYFKNLKGKTPYLLYPKYGIHWSQYAMTLASDSLVKFIETKQNIRMQHFKWKDTKLKKANDTDYDVGRSMNLLTYLNGPKMGYPEIYIEENNGEVKPSLVVIADSFYWGIFNMGFSKLFSKSQFWYYNNEVYPDHYNSPTYVHDLDFSSQIKDHSVFVVMATEQNIVNSGWGFIDAVLELEKQGDIK